MSHRVNNEIRIRVARETDLAAVTRVAGRDSHRPPAWPILVAEVGAEIRAAISLTDGEVVADPFHRTAELVEMLRIRAENASPGSAGTVVPLERPARERLAVRSAA
jgi:hypothetical protein